MLCHLVCCQTRLISERFGKPDVLQILYRQRAQQVEVAYDFFGRRCSSDEQPAMPPCVGAWSNTLRERRLPASCRIYQMKRISVETEGTVLCTKVKCKAKQNLKQYLRFEVLFHDLLLRSCLYHCVQGEITSHISLQTTVIDN